MLRNDLQVGVIAILRTADPENFEKIADGWKMSADERKLLIACRDLVYMNYSSPMDVNPSTLFNLAYFNDQDEIFAETILAATDRIHLISSFYQRWDTIQPMPINGNDVIECGWKGKEIGEVLKVFKSIWFLRDFNDTREGMLNTLRQYTKENLERK